MNQKWEIVTKPTNEFVIDRRSYTHNLSSCEIKAWKKFRPERDSNPWPLRCDWWITNSYLSPQFKYIIFHIFIYKGHQIMESHFQITCYYITMIIQDDIRIVKTLQPGLNMKLGSWWELWVRLWLSLKGVLKRMLVALPTVSVAISRPGMAFKILCLC